MKWSEEQTAKLKELATNGVSNKDIATALLCRVEDVYAKRSQLGITIDKCKGKPAVPNPTREAAVEPIMPKRGMTRYERIKAMSITNVAEQIIQRQITDEYCKSNCETADEFNCDGNRELQCCIRWLDEVK